MATRGEEHVTMETEVGVMWPQVKACQSSPEDGRDKDWIVP